MSIHRVEQWLAQPLPPKPDFRRCQCRCGCGRWWYWPRSNVGRTPVYATPECYARWRNRDRMKVLTCQKCSAVFTKAGRGRRRKFCPECKP